jgi:hypothetical protein
MKNHSVILRPSSYVSQSKHTSVQLWQTDSLDAAKPTSLPRGRNVLTTQPNCPETSFTQQESMQYSYALARKKRLTRKLLEQTAMKAYSAELQLFYKCRMISFRLLQATSVVSWHRLFSNWKLYFAPMIRYPLKLCSEV